MAQKLTTKQERFVEEYLIDLNATAAYLRAGYAPNTREVVSVNASDLLATPKIQALVAERQAELSRRTGITQERVLREYARIAFADMRAFANVGHGGLMLRPSADWSDDDAAAVAELGESVTDKGGRNLRFKLHDKTRALDSIAKMLGYFPKEEKGGDTNNIALTEINVTVNYVRRDAIQGH